MNRNRFAFAVPVFLLVVMGCDPSVDSFQENDLHYSIFGYLNASADTQFVRVELLRDGLLTRAPATLDADVTLTNLATEHTTSLQDSLFHYLDGATAHNFYTTVDIEPTATYRLTVQGPDGAESHAQTSIPDTFPAPTVIVPADTFPTCSNFRGNSEIAVVEVQDIERLVAVRAIYYMVDLERVWSFGHLADTVQTGTGAVRARIDYGHDWCRIPQRGEAERIEVVVAAGDPDWPDFMGMAWETEVLPDVASNVEGGTGLLGGVVTDTAVVYPYHEEE